MNKKEQMELEKVTVEIPKPLLDAVRSQLKLRLYEDLSDFVTCAIRDKIEKWKRPK